MCITIRTLKNKVRKDTRITFYKVVAMPILTCRCKDQVNSKIKEEMTILYVNNTIVKPISQWDYHVLPMDDRQISKYVLTYNPKIRRNIGRPQLRWRDQDTL